MMVIKIEASCHYVYTVATEMKCSFLLVDFFDMVRCCQELLWHVSANPLNAQNLQLPLESVKVLT